MVILIVRVVEVRAAGAGVVDEAGVAGAEAGAVVEVGAAGAEAVFEVVGPVAGVLGPGAGAAASVEDEEESLGRAASSPGLGCPGDGAVGC